MQEPTRLLIALTSVTLALCASIVFKQTFTPLPLKTQQELTSHTANMSAASNLLKVSRSVIKKVYAVETAEGVGATVRRTIGTPNLMNLSPFLMFVTSLTIILWKCLIYLTPIGSIIFSES